VENALLRKALEMSNGNQIKATKLLQMPSDASRRMMKLYVII